MSQSEMICRCFRVSRATVEQAVDVLGAENVKDIVRITEAGSGCMCCRCKIQELIEQRRAQNIELELA
ncbi:MAG: (2Fe-2S)-binding protein [Planctomycetaceae bacterium]|nr:(2Fe-2S)-binding protein [Planctomycetaceae bacterium]